MGEGWVMQEGCLSLSLSLSATSFLLNLPRLQSVQQALRASGPRETPGSAGN